MRLRTSSSNRTWPTWTSSAARWGPADRKPGGPHRAVGAVLRRTLEAAAEPCAARAPRVRGQGIALLGCCVDITGQVATAGGMTPGSERGKIVIGWPPGQGHLAQPGADCDDEVSHRLPALVRQVWTLPALGPTATGCAVDLERYRLTSRPKLPKWGSGPAVEPPVGQVRRARVRHGLRVTRRLRIRRWCGPAGRRCVARGPQAARH